MWPQLPIWANLALFALSAALVWGAGTRLAVYVDGISECTGIGQAFVGMLLLGGITSLPELATVASSAASGNAPLAVNNLLGTAAINILLLAVADAVLGRDALTSVVAQPGTLFQGTLGILLLAIVAAGVITGEVAFFGVGLWSAILLTGCLLSLWLSSKYERRHVWTVVGDEADAREGDGWDGRPDTPALPLRGLVIRTAAAGVLILCAGFFLSQTGDAIARQTGLGASLVGLVLVGFGTSLPELSSITSALRLRRYEMAVGDIFGTNLFNIALIFVADLFYRRGPVLAETGRFEAVAALIALVMTAVFVLGLLERRDTTVLRMGVDSLAAIGIYAGGLALLFVLQAGG